MGESLRARIGDSVDALTEALLVMESTRADAVLRGAVDDRGERIPPDVLVCEALERIGQEWERGEASLSQVYLAAKACEGLLRALAPPEPAGVAGDIALVVFEDRHALGAQLVRSALRCAGIEPSYWGSLSAAATTARALADRPSVLLVSTLMLRAALLVGPMVKELRAAGLTTAVIVGGAPFRFDPSLWREVGADAMGRTAADAIALVKATRRAAR